jgi:hypothetical protein
MYVDVTSPVLGDSIFLVLKVSSSLLPGGYILILGWGEVNWEKSCCLVYISNPLNG